jgi:two-component system, chemotaxis family, protein-glutamate methylesterase/glutaminase
MLLQRPPLWLRPGERPFEVVAIGASAGGLHALRAVLADLSSDFPGAILVAQHRGERPLRTYCELLQGLTSMRVTEAQHRERVSPGILYLAPEGRHIELGRDRTIYTDRCERLATVRPSVDLLFETVSECYGDVSVGVILSGRGRDGAAGVRTIRERGGFVIAQDRGSSAEFGMPCSAIETRRVDLVLPLELIGFALNTLFRGASAVAQN